MRTIPDNTRWLTDVKIDIFQKLSQPMFVPSQLYTPLPPEQCCLFFQLPRYIMHIFKSNKQRQHCSGGRGVWLFTFFEKKLPIGQEFCPGLSRIRFPNLFFFRIRTYIQFCIRDTACKGACLLQRTSSCCYFSTFCARFHEFWVPLFSWRQCNNFADFHWHGILTRCYPFYNVLFPSLHGTQLHNIRRMNVMGKGVLRAYGIEN